MTVVVEDTEVKIKKNLKILKTKYADYRKYKIQKIYNTENITYWINKIHTFKIWTIQRSEYIKTENT